MNTVKMKSIVNAEVGEKEMAAINQFVEEIKAQEYIWLNGKNGYVEVLLSAVDEKYIYLSSRYGDINNWEGMSWSEAKVGEIPGEMSEEECRFFCKIPRSLLARQDMTPEQKQAFTREQWRQIAYYKKEGTLTLLTQGARERKIVTEDYTFEWPDQDVSNEGVKATNILKGNDPEMGSPYSE